MTPRLAVMEAVEKLNYRVTIGDVAAQSGLNLNLVQSELLSLSSEASGHMQVAESGEIAYVFTPKFRQILRDRSFKLRLQAWLQVVWKWAFYVIRISFGILLIVSIAIVVLGIFAALIALQQGRSSDSDDRSDRNDQGGGWGFMPSIWWGNPFIIFDTSYNEPRKLKKDPEEMGFLESIFSFLFGDGNPNFDQEERRNRAIASVIRNNGGVAIAEQVTPYLDDLGLVMEGYEDYMIPVLSKFNGLPEVSDQGTLIYRFPDLQKVATEREQVRVAESLQLQPWTFSKAGSGKISLAIGLGVFYLVGALILGNLLGQLGAVSSGFLGFVSGAYVFLLVYATLFLTVPLVRYFVLKSLNRKIEQKNLERQSRAIELMQSSELSEKLKFARQFATQQEVISADNLAYTTETDLSDQEYEKFLKGVNSP
jgi:uncharacterized membrane protein